MVAKRRVNLRRWAGRGRGAGGGRAAQAQQRGAASHPPLPLTWDWVGLPYSATRDDRITFPLGFSHLSGLFCFCFSGKFRVSSLFLGVGSETPTSTSGLCFELGGVGGTGESMVSQPSRFSKQIGWRSLGKGPTQLVLRPPLTTCVQLAGRRVLKNPSPVPATATA